MARTIVTLEPETLYRAVRLELYPGIHDLELKTYVDANGDSFHYHRVSVNGPYAAKGTANAQVGRMLKDHEWRLEKGWRNGGNYYTNTVPGTVPEVKTFVEALTPSWSVVAGTIKEA